jgi:Rrf2 family protein
MKLSAQEEYGLRCLLQIATEPARFLTIPEIARREALSVAYVAKLMRVLRKAGFVRSVRGQRGGFELTAPPAEVNVGRVLDALGGRLYSETFCVDHSGDRRVCVRDVDCSLRALWAAVDQAVHAVLDRTTLDRLVCGERGAGDWLRRLEFDVASSSLRRN